MNARAVAATFGCTEEQARAAYARNAAQLAAMWKRALATGRKVNGYTAEQLAERAARAYTRATEGA